MKRAVESAGPREAELLDILESIPDGVCVTVEDRFCAWNTAFERLTGRSAEELRALHPADIMTPDDADRARERLRGLMAGTEPLEPREYRISSPDGRETPVEVFSAHIHYRGAPALVTTMRDVNARDRAEHDLARSRDRLRAVLRHVQAVREDERASVARDLHDDLGSVLTALKIELSLLRDLVDARQAEPLQHMDELLDDAIDIGRRVVTGLRPGILDDLGLASAVEWLGRDFSAHSGIRCDLALPREHVELPEVVSIAVFRIVQEALTNVVRHANANRVSIRLDVGEESVELRLSDDGAGFEIDELPPEERHGMDGMVERAMALGGTLEIDSSEGGTRVRAWVPLG